MGPGNEGGQTGEALKAEVPPPLRNYTLTPVLSLSQIQLIQLVDTRYRRYEIFNEMQPLRLK